MLSVIKGIFGSNPTVPLYVDGRNVHRGKCNAVGKKRPCDCKEYERIDSNKFDFTCKYCGHFPTTHDNRGRWNPNSLNKAGPTDPDTSWVPFIQQKLARRFEIVVDDGSEKFIEIAKQYGDAREIKIMYFQELLAMDPSKPLTVKFIMTNIAQETWNPFKKCTELIKEAVAINSQAYGYYHTAVQIGPVVIDWNSTSLVHVRPLHSTVKKSVFFVDVFASNREFAIRNEDGLVDKIIKVIIKYNTTKEYHGTQNNCQDFTIELFEAIGIKQFEKYLGPYTLAHLNYLRKTGGNAKAVYTFRGVEYTFATHAELDLHVEETKKLGLEDQNNEDRLNLLKGFDRAFHMRFENAPNEENRPHPELGCPWGMPTRM